VSGSSNENKRTKEKKEYMSEYRIEFSSV
jgi:hypothetical protein